MRPGLSADPYMSAQLTRRGPQEALHQQQLQLMHTVDSMPDQSRYGPGIFGEIWLEAAASVTLDAWSLQRGHEVNYRR